MYPLVHVSNYQTITVISLDDLKRI